MTELGLQFSLCWYVVWPVCNNYCQKVFCIAKLLILNPLARDNILLPGLFLTVPWCFCTADFSTTHSEICEAERKSRGLAIVSFFMLQGLYLVCLLFSILQSFIYLFYASFLGFSGGAYRKSRENYVYSIFPEAEGLQLFSELQTYQSSYFFDIFACQ